MVVSSAERHCENHTDIYPLLMDREHIIDITRSGEVSSSTTTHDDPVVMVGTLLPQNESRPSISTNRTSVPELPFPSSNPLNSRNPSFLRRGGENGRRRSPLNSVVWISIELLLTLSQIIASIVVLSLSRHEHPHSPLRAWIIGYASGCVAIIPLLYWRFCHRNQGSEQDSVQSRQNAGLDFSLPVRTSEEEDRGENVTTIRNSQNAARLSARIKVLVDYFKMMLDCFFAVWFVVGNVWIFGGHGSAADAPNLYRLCIVFLTFSCIGYAMPFILCATICCCLPCIISVLGFSEDLVQTRGATTESINSLPTYKFKLKKRRNGHDKETNSSVTEGGGIVAAGTDKERVISGDDAVCCICLAKYANNDELRELPCSHFFHKDCVDKWLKINALCPLCKSEVGSTVLEAMSRSNTIG